MYVDKGAHRLSLKARRRKKEATTFLVVNLGCFFQVCTARIS